jgi:hypothetical protein
MSSCIYKKWKQEHWHDRFLVVTMCGHVGSYQSFGRTYCRNIQPFRVSVGYTREKETDMAKITCAFLKIRCESA